MAKAKKLPSGNYRVLEYVGKDITKSGYKSFTAPTRAEAEYEAKLFKIDTRFQNAPLKKLDPKVTVSQVIDQYIASRNAILSPTTIEGYEKIKRNYFQDIMSKPAMSIDQSALQYAVNEECKRTSALTHQPLSPKTINSACSFIISVLQSYNKKVDLSGISLPQRVKVKYATPDSDGIIAILAATYNTQIEVAVLLAVWLSMSISEIRGLKFSDVHDGYVRVHEAVVTVNGKHVTKTTKTEERTRDIILPAHVKKRIDLLPRNSEYVVPYTRASVYERFKRILEKNGIPHCRFHDLRHAAASVMVILNIPDKYAMARGGWSTDRTMKEAYQQIFSKEEIAVAKKIDNYFDKLVKKSMIQHETQHKKSKTA